MSHVKLIYDAEKGIMVPRDGTAGERARAPRICYVDDSRTSSYVTLKILRQYGYEVEAFATAEEALEALMERDFDLLLTDLVLSRGEGMNGDDLVRVLRQCGLPEKAQMPTVVITGDQDGAVGERLHQAGVDEVLVKPVKGKELNQVLRRLLARREEAAPVLEQAVGRPGAETASNRQDGEERSEEAAPEPEGVVTQVIDGFEDFERPSIFSELDDPLRARRPAAPEPTASAPRPNPFLDDAQDAPPSFEPPSPAPGAGPGPSPDEPASREARRPAPPPPPREPAPPPPREAAERPAPAAPPEPEPEPPPAAEEPSAILREDSLLSLLEDMDEGTREPSPPTGPRRALGIPLLLTLLAVFLGAAGFGAWAWWQGREPEVELVAVTRGPIYEVVHAAGRVVSDRFLDVTSHGPGQLVAVLVEEGDRVEKGQLLARMDDQDAKMRVKRIEARLISLEEEVGRARKVLERLQRAFQVGAVSRQALDDAEAEWTAASARHAVAKEELAAARLELERTRIKAPFAGIVTEVKAHPGQWIAPPQPILRLVDDRRRVVRLRVDTADSARLAPGQVVILASEAFPDRRWREQVLRVAPSTEAHVVEVEVSLGRNAPPLRLGQPVTGEIRIQGSERALKLPLEALVEWEGRPAVMMVRDGVIHYVPVELGIEDFTHVEIRSGLRAGDQVVLPQGRVFREGQAVKVVGLRD